MNPSFFNLSSDEVAQRLKTMGLPAFRAKQIGRQVYVNGVTDYTAMSDLPKELQQKLAAELPLALPAVKRHQQSADGTIKWLLSLADGQDVEMVFIPEADRGTLCVSSQVGCTLTCRFCHTGTQGLARNLTTGEIIGQIHLARTHLNDWGKRDEGRRLTNIVFMGQGEPLYNVDNVEKAVRILTDDQGMAWGGRKITVSTSGVVPEIPRLGKLGVNLAISLHAPDDITRTRIMPINRKYPLAQLIAAVKAFPLREHRRITWEYVMLDGINDSDAHAHNLIKRIAGIPSLVNIIPFNEWPGAPFKCSPLDRINRFANQLTAAGIDATVRKTRGEDILAACGQLRTETSGYNTVSAEFPTVVAQYGGKKKTSVKIESGET